MADKTMVDYTRKIKPYFEGVAPIEPTTTAASAHAVGDIFYLDGTLVECTVAISVGDTIAVGTNVVAADDVETQIGSKADASDLDDKADKVSNAVNGNFASLDANGNLTDSGKNASDFVTALSGTTASTNGEVKYNYTKAGSDTGVSASVYGWNPLVGKWTNAVTALISATSVSLTNPFSTASVDVFPVCQNSSGTPITVKTINATSGTITLTFDALTEDTSFKAIVKASV